MEEESCEQPTEPPDFLVFFVVEGVGSFLRQGEKE